MRAKIEKKIEYIGQFKNAEILRHIAAMIGDNGIESVLGVNGIDDLTSRIVEQQRFSQHLKIENRRLK